MVDRVNMDYKIEVLSGYARTTSVYPAATGQTFEEGDVVEMTAGGWSINNQEVGPDTAVVSGIVLRGHTDDKSVAASNKPVVLLGEALIRVDASKVTGTPALGALVNYGAAGKVAAVSAATAYGKVIEVGPSNAWFVIDWK